MMTQAMRRNGVINAGRRRNGLELRPPSSWPKPASDCARVLGPLVDCALEAASESRWAGDEPALDQVVMPVAFTGGSVNTRS